MMPTCLGCVVTRVDGVYPSACTHPRKPHPPARTRNDTHTTTDLAYIFNLTWSAFIVNRRVSARSNTITMRNKVEQFKFSKDEKLLILHMVLPRAQYWMIYYYRRTDGSGSVCPTFLFNVSMIQNGIDMLNNTLQMARLSKNRLATDFIFLMQIEIIIIAFAVTPTNANERDLKRWTTYNYD